MRSVFYTALALAAAASAAEVDQYRGGRGFYGHGGFYGGYGGYGGSRYGGYGGYRPQPQPYQKPNPWGPTEEEKEEEEEKEQIDYTGWWNPPYQQYSPPLIQYKPFPIAKTVYTVCELLAVTDQDESGDIEIAQMPYQAPSIRYDLSNLDAEAEYSLKINTLGRLGDDCADVGSEFNPLKEVKKGIANPYQDPARGRIDDITATVDGTFSGAQDKLLQNLAGPDSLIGRSLLLSTTVTEVDPDAGVNIEREETRACCVIALDDAPESMQQQQQPAYWGPQPSKRPKRPQRPTYYNYNRW